MGFLKGKTKTLSGTPTEIQPLRGSIASQLGSAIGGGALGQGFQGILGQGGQPQAQDTRFFYENILKPYTDLFAAQRGAALGQAKESAGNLTGSGYNNILGSSLSESLASEQATTAQTLMGLREQELQRQQDFLRLLFGFATAGVGPPQTVYQPGFLDSILPFAGQAAGQYFANRGRPTISPGPTNRPGQTTSSMPQTPGLGVPGGYRPFEYGGGFGR